MTTYKKPKAGEGKLGEGKHLGEGRQPDAGTVTSLRLGRVTFAEVIENAAMLRLGV